MAFELDSNNFKIRLKEVRKTRKLTQQELAAKTGIPVTSIAHFESGSRKPSLENFYKLIVVLNVSADYILGRSEKMSACGIDPIMNTLQKLPEIERRMIEKFIASLENDQIKSED
ncbi:helix-turn-helix transcriptional regulator [Acinetobacter variabilis]|uniref:Helix-turn-helix transcriptional regulator n=2 Tax=Acinetobacter TaxID=469 RepID=A0A558F609_9GAMM|nr:MULTISPECIES: helix-turn-helix transcriptional regulator [Pseudomonadota]MCU4312911.1 helix-turn-helix transcriptional regulator [Acinetobacter variabilis]MCU4365377.1 helix-turn-helix transcriptional regulator [Acinetobacter variabilis]MCU4375268.1 helix-turn-helix transcriptional regulator [Acinetobacter variabilis]MCU4450747.1 helix-turn-helix transcriptional regulator [Acinetobacter lwoffii]MCU4520095.1 helix-turn-helix transcriptional regulator [Acinetobacter schindleri]